MHGSGRTAHPPAHSDISLQSLWRTWTTRWMTWAIQHAVSKHPTMSDDENEEKKHKKQKWSCKGLGGTVAVTHTTLVLQFSVSRRKATASRTTASDFKYLAMIVYLLGVPNNPLQEFPASQKLRSWVVAANDSWWLLSDQNDSLLHLSSCDATPAKHAAKWCKTIHLFV